jgi:gamma-glutamyl hydrolase
MSGDLQSFWKVAATTTTETEEVFVSMIEAEDHPFYGVQFRPEVNMFEWKMDADRSEGGVRIAQILSNKMVEKVRKNNNTLRNPYFLPADSIYLYDPTTNNPTFSLTYVFPELALVQEDTTTLEK